MKRFNVKQIGEFYGATEGNSNLGTYLIFSVFDQLNVLPICKHNRWKKLMAINSFRCNMNV